MPLPGLIGFPYRGLSEKASTSVGAASGPGSETSHRCQRPWLSAIDKGAEPPSAGLSEPFTRIRVVFRSPCFFPRAMGPSIELVVMASRAFRYNKKAL